MLPFYGQLGCNATFRSRLLKNLFNYLGLSRPERRVTFLTKPLHFLRQRCDVNKIELWRISILVYFYLFYINN
jgi:hypothetical protein